MLWFALHLSGLPLEACLAGAPAAGNSWRRVPPALSISHTSLLSTG